MAVLDATATAQQAHEGFVDQRGGLQRVLGILAPHLARGNEVELAVQDVGHPTQRILVAVSSACQQHADVGTIVGHSSPPVRSNGRRD